MPSADRPSNTVCSYASVHEEFAAKSKSYATKYHQFVIEYAEEWSKVIRTRIDNGIKKAEELRIELDHYQKKTEALRLSANQAMAKGKPVSSAVQERLTRNEEKLIASKQNYNQVATDLCILLDEVTQRSWRDVHPLLVKCAQFDMTLANDQANALSNLNQVVSALKAVATEHGLSPQPRLKDLAGLKPELLSTRPGGVAGLAIEAGPISSTFDSTALPPGSVGAQGMGGFPVAVGSGSDDGLSPTAFARTNSYTSSHSAPVISPTGGGFSSNTTFDPLASTNMNALTISTTAPAPTYDDVYGSSSMGGGGGNYANPLSSRSAPASGNFPPLPPASYTPTAGSTSGAAPSAWNVRSSSFNDIDSTYSAGNFSGMASPPPLPPPPNMPPPPPPPPSGGGGMASYGAPLPPSSSFNNYGSGYGSGGGYPPPMSQPPPMMMMGGGMPPARPPPSMYPSYNTNAPVGAPPPKPGYNPFG
jgi:hypothetical protein